MLKEEHSLIVTRQKLINQKGCVVWIIGHSGSGKSTLACSLSRDLYTQGNLSCILDETICAARMKVTVIRRNQIGLDLLSYGISSRIGRTKRINKIRRRWRWMSNDMAACVSAVSKE
ncbi:unnamed protein product [Microthlaspi erraticum]|uniref:APS kinase domain-containing protein n=1 Tax=Microthlaspi erraticum TaxID=1685480 RepID=A0A6D2JY00_9BRAS|nr:unnamed protein product [Microthlaspi erraticum]CAA7042026.1 unnamed protein product [Microthlaspi erraticum]